MTVTTNLRVLSPSRQRPRPGDLFALCPADDLYLFGRVINTEAWAGPPMPHAILIYIYEIQGNQSVPRDRGELTRDRLLVPPIMTNRLPWSRGYFQTIANSPLLPGDAFERHCFRDSLRGICFDEFTNRLSRCVEPCGELGLHSFRTIDDAISQALGIPLAPD